MFQKQPIDVAAYIWPAYTGDEPRSRIFWPEGIGEWESVKNSTRKPPDYHWKRKPIWGYVNEADPRVMEMEINAAADHAVNVFIYDWYWFDRRPFLEQCLDNGFLKAENRDRMKFFVMWANHNANYVWDKRNSDLPNAWETIVWRGDVDRKEFEVIGHRLIDNYFHQPNYYTIDGKPVFMLYNMSNLISGLGGEKHVIEAFDWLREEAVRSGLPGLHLLGIPLRSKKPNLSGVDDPYKSLQISSLAEFGVDSATDYSFAQFANPGRDYLEILPDVQEEWRKLEKNCGVPYIPHVTIGWDNNPRFREFHDGAIMRNNTPENFEKGLLMAKEYLLKNPYVPQMVTINSWNEWTETSYLQPDDLYGYGYLEAVKKVFGK